MDTNEPFPEDIQRFILRPATVEEERQVNDLNAKTKGELLKWANDQQAPVNPHVLINLYRELIRMNRMGSLDVLMTFTDTCCPSPESLLYDVLLHRIEFFFDIFPRPKILPEKLPRSVDPDGLINLEFLTLLLVHNKLNPEMSKDLCKILTRWGQFVEESKNYYTMAKSSNLDQPEDYEELKNCHDISRAAVAILLKWFDMIPESDAQFMINMDVSQRIWLEQQCSEAMFPQRKHMEMAENLDRKPSLNILKATNGFGSRHMQLHEILSKICTCELPIGVTWFMKECSHNTCSTNSPSLCDQGMECFRTIAQIRRSRNFTFHVLILLMEFFLMNKMQKTCKSMQHRRLDRFIEIWKGVYCGVSPALYRLLLKFEAINPEEGIPKDAPTTPEEELDYFEENDRQLANWKANEKLAEDEQKHGAEYMAFKQEFIARNADPSILTLRTENIETTIKQRTALLGDGMGAKSSNSKKMPSNQTVSSRM